MVEKIAGINYNFQDNVPIHFVKGIKKCFSNNNILSHLIGQLVKIYAIKMKIDNAWQMFSINV